MFYVNAKEGLNMQIVLNSLLQRKILSLVYIFCVFWVNPIIGVTWGFSSRRPRALLKRFSLRDHSLTRKMWISRAWERMTFIPSFWSPQDKKELYNVRYLNILLVVTIFTAKTRRKFGLFTMARICFYCDVAGSAPTTPPCSVTTFCYFKPRPFWNSLEIIWLSQVLCESIQEVFVMLKIIPCIHGEHFSHWHRFLFCTAIMRNKQSKAKTVYCSVKNSN